MAFKINGEVKEKVLLQYCPHGIDSDMFFPIESTNPTLKEFRTRLFSGKDYQFVIMYNSRNVHRKRTSNIILAFRHFCDNIPEEESSKCVLVLHTEIMQDAGTNLIAVKEALCPNYNIVFSPGKLSPQDMNMMYNIADTVVNASSNEGFGLSVAESIMCGTPITVAVTGGLQDQIGQVDDDGNPIIFNAKFGSNTIGKYKKHGPWAYPVWPVSRLVQGSIPTPYIFDDITKWEDFAEGFMYWYMMGPEKREKCGDEGRRWALNEGGINSKNMGQTFIDGMEYVFENWQRPKSFGLFSVKDHIGHTMPNGQTGFEIHKINKSTLQNKINSLNV